MATLTVTVPDAELADLASATADQQSTTDPERIAHAETWLTDYTRTVLWSYQRSVAGAAVPDPMPPE